MSDPITQDVTIETVEGILLTTPVVIQEGEFATMSFQDQFTNNLNQSIFFSLSLPIFNGFGIETNIDRAEVDVLSAQLAKEQTAQSLTQTVEQSWADARAAQRTFEANDRALEAATLAMTNAEARFEAGAISALEYADARFPFGQRPHQRASHPVRLCVQDAHFGLLPWTPPQPLIMNKKLLLGLGAFVVLLVVAVVKGGSRTLPQVSTEEIARRSIVERVSASGKIQPEVEVKITAEVNGQITELPVKEGDVVAKGNLLVQLNPDIYDAALLRAEAGLNSAKSNLASARAQVAQGEANQLAAEKPFQRAEALLAQKVISQAEYDQTEASYLTANANLTSANESVRSAEYAIRSGEASLQEAKDNLSRTTLRAPKRASSPRW